ncbi:MAG: glycosyltransferase family 2 protein [Vicinamibacterales bacterium]
MTPSQAPVSVVVLTFNEELNLPVCLESVTGWAARIFVVDSGSTDQTVAIARASGAEVITHAFETHARQWQWALANLPIKTEWILGLDADQRVGRELAEAIAALVSSNTPANGAFVCRRQIFRGRWIRYGGYYPKHLLKLFKRAHVSLDAGDLVDHHFSVAGATVVLAGDLIEDNCNEAQIAVWTAKHNRYAVLQARQEKAATAGSVSLLALFGQADDRVRVLKRIWAGLPLFVRPCLYVFYRYVIRLGFLDGKQGFVFHVLQAFWYRLLVDINIDELRLAAPQSSRSDVVVVSHTPPSAESTVRTKHPS